MEAQTIHLSIKIVGSVCLEMERAMEKSPHNKKLAKVAESLGKATLQMGQILYPDEGLETVRKRLLDVLTLREGLPLPVFDDRPEGHTTAINPPAENNAVVRLFDLWKQRKLCYPLIPCGMEQLYEAYSSWAYTQGGKISTRNAFRLSVSKETWQRVKTRLCLPVGHVLCRKYVTFVMPPASLIPKQYRQREYQQEGHYLTESYLAFEKALNVGERQEN